MDCGCETFQSNYADFKPYQSESVLNNNLVFDLTDSSLEGYSFKLYYDRVSLYRLLNIMLNKLKILLFNNIVYIF